jgi:hypothetical protein
MATFGRVETVAWRRAARAYFRTRLRQLRTATLRDSRKRFSRAGHYSVLIVQSGGLGIPANTRAYSPRRCKTELIFAFSLARRR